MCYAKKSDLLIVFYLCREQVCCGIIFRGPHGEVAIDPRFMNPCSTCKPLKEPLTPLNYNNNETEDMETDDSASTTSSTMMASNASKLVTDEADDEGFFDKPAVSPSESGTSTPPPSSESDSMNVHEEEIDSNFLLTT